MYIRVPFTPKASHIESYSLNRDLSVIQNLTEHPQLATPLAVEALLELRFKSPEAYGLVPGRLFEALRDEFPTSEELPMAKLPIDFGPTHAVRHRFISSDEKYLYQVGADIISINTVGYDSYSAFAERCKRVLVAAQEVAFLPSIDRIGLRYINRAPLDRPWDNIISLRFTAPEVIETTAEAQLHRWITRFGDVGVLSTTIGWPAGEEGADTDEQFMMIDLDHFKEPAEMSTVDEILAWLNIAHENVYQVFKSSLLQEYFDFLKGDSNARQS